MRSFDPRSWNLLKPASVLALTACQTATLDDGADTGTGDSTETIGTSVGTVTTYTSYTSYTTYTTYTTYTSYTSYTSYTTYNYNPCNYCAPDEECIDNQCVLQNCDTSVDCPDGEACIEGVCGMVPESLYCGVWPTLTIDIPAVAGVIDLAFVDVDGDGDDELALLTADGVSVIDEDLSLTETAWVMPGQYTNLVGLRVDGDATLDLAFTNSTLPGLRTVLGNGDGSFGGEVDDLLAPLVDPIAMDLDTDGQDELVGLINGVPTTVNGVGEAALTSPIGGTPSAQHLDHGDNDGDAQRDLLLAGEAGDPLLLTANWLLATVGSWAAGDAQQMLSLSGPSLWAAFDLDGDGLDNAFAVADGMGSSVIQSWSHPIPSLATVPETGLVWIVGAEFDGTNGEEVLLGSASPRLVQRLNANPIGCSYPLQDFPSGGTRAVAGDFDGDGIDEVAVLVNGTVEMRASNF